MDKWKEDEREERNEENSTELGRRDGCDVNSIPWRSETIGGTRNFHNRGCSRLRGKPGKKKLGKGGEEMEKAMEEISTQTGGIATGIIGGVKRGQGTLMTPPVRGFSGVKGRMIVREIGWKGSVNIDKCEARVE